MHFTDTAFSSNASTLVVNAFVTTLLTWDTTTSTFNATLSGHRLGTSSLSVFTA